MVLNLNVFSKCLNLSWTLKICNELHACFDSAGFLFYAALIMTAVFVLIFHFIPEYGHTHIMVYIGVCSLVGSLSVRQLCMIYSNDNLYWGNFLKNIPLQVMSVKALGIALKLTLSGMNQLIYPQTWAFSMIVTACVVTQMNYLNKVTFVHYLYHSHAMRLSSSLKPFLDVPKVITWSVTQSRSDSPLTPSESSFSSVILNHGSLVTNSWW